MDYAAHYNRLIERAIGRQLDGYVESHHAVPRCIGGPDEPWNLVYLTAEEHYVAHQLLVKILPHRDELVYAAKMMTVGSRRRSNKLYGWLRRKHAERVGKNFSSPKTEAHRAAMSIAAKKRYADPAARAAQAAHLRAKCHARIQPLGVSGFRGVQQTSSGKWHFRTKTWHAGVFNTPEEASAARSAFLAQK